LPFKAGVIRSRGPGTGTCRSTRGSSGSCRSSNSIR
jgi:hypothetical protein